MIARIRSKLSSGYIGSLVKALHIAISVGAVLAEIDPQQADLKGLTKIAVKNVYEAKEGGRDQLVAVLHLPFRHR